jgi:hypothetical protein
LNCVFFPSNPWDTDCDLQDVLLHHSSVLPWEHLSFLTIRYGFLTFCWWLAAFWAHRLTFRNSLTCPCCWASLRFVTICWRFFIVYISCWSAYVS